MIEAALWLAFALVVIATVWWFVLIVAFLFDWSSRRTVMSMMLTALAAVKIWWDRR